MPETRCPALPKSNECLSIAPPVIWEHKAAELCVMVCSSLVPNAGGEDHLVKLWNYDEGAVTHVGVGHSGTITRLKICPEKKHIVSVSADGAILLWKYPDLH